MTIRNKNDVKIPSNTTNNVETSESIKDRKCATNKNLENLTTQQSSLYNGTKLTAKGVLLIISLASTLFAACTSWSLIAPFLPRVAESKGLTISQYTLIFTIYEVVRMILPPFLSKVAIKMTPKFLHILSLLIIAICSTLFGLLIYEEDGHKFFYLCLIVRAVWAIGGAGSVTCANTLAALLFPNHIATAYAALEIASGMGFIAGPVIGGYLYEKFSFVAPFLATSIFALLSIIPIILLVQNELKPKNENINEKSATFFQAMKVPGITINLFVNIVTCFSIGFNESTLDHHLREIGEYSPIQVGRVFLISGLVFSIFAYLNAYLTEKWSRAEYVVVPGCLLLAVTFVFIGPLPFIPVEPNLTFVIISQFVLGVALGPLFVICFSDCIKESKKYLPNNDRTIAMINGVYASTYSVGHSIGPIIGGQMVERYGYRSATVPAVIISIVAALLYTIYVTKLKK